jgi:hypothetical protein
MSNKDTRVATLGEVPAALQRYVGEDFERTQVRLTASRSIGTKGGTFSIGDEDLGDHIEMSVIDWVNMNVYYEGKWQPNVQRGARCFALGRAEHDVLEPPSTLDPISSSCSDCEKNEWESDPGGGRGKACKNVVRLVVAPLSEIYAGNAVTLYNLIVPVTSVASWMKAAYATESKKGIPIRFLEMHIDIESQSTGGHSLAFSAPSFVDDSVIDVLDGLHEDCAGQLVEPPFLDTGEDGAATTKRSRATSRRPGAKAAPKRAPKRSASKPKKSGAKRTRKR